MKPDIGTFAKFYKEARKRVSMSRIPADRKSKFPWSVSSVQRENARGDMTWVVVDQGPYARCRKTYRWAVIRQGYWLLYGGIDGVPYCWAVGNTGTPSKVLRKMWREAKG